MPIHFVIRESREFRIVEAFQLSEEWDGQGLLTTLGFLRLG